jgi:hypothetical protein
MLTLPKPDPDRDFDAEREDLYERLTRGITVALDVYADARLAEARRRGAGPDESAAIDRPVPPPIAARAALDFAIDLLRAEGREDVAWLIVETLALRGGSPAKVMDAVVALHTLHKGPPPPLVETARKAAAAGAGRRPLQLARPTITPTGPTWGDRLFPGPGRNGGGAG